jgi:exosortase
LGNSTEYIAIPLRHLATKVTTVIAHSVLGIDVVQNGTSIWEPSGRYQYEVAAACSGLRSLTAIFALATIYGFLEFRKNWQRLAIIASAFPLAVIGNVVRLTTIIVAAETFGQSAGNYVHESLWFSLLPYVPPIAGLLFLGHLLGKRTAHPLGVLEVKSV